MEAHKRRRCNCGKVTSRVKLWCSTLTRTRLSEDLTVHCSVLQCKLPAPVFWKTNSHGARKLSTVRSKRLIVSAQNLLALLVYLPHAVPGSSVTMAYVLLVPPGCWSHSLLHLERLSSYQLPDLFPISQTTIKKPYLTSSKLLTSKSVLPKQTSIILPVLFVRE